MASPNVSELVTTTIRNRSRKLADIVTDNLALLYRLKEKGNVRTFSGGTKIMQELEYAENATAMWYSGSEILDVSASDVLSAAEYEIKQAAVAVIVTGLEELQNASKERMIDLVSARVGNAEKTLQNLVGAACYSDGTGSGGKEVAGLQYLIQDTVTGTVGGISTTSGNTWWKNYTFDATTTGGAAVTSSNILGYMNTVWSNVVRNTDAPDFMPCDNAYFTAFEAAMQGIQRISSSKMADAGYQALKYKGADVVLDGGVDGQCPANHMYFVNSDYLFLRPHTKCNFTQIGSKREAVNQDVTVKFLGFAGNLACSNRQLQAVLKD